MSNMLFFFQQWSSQKHLIPMNAPRDQGSPLQYFQRLSDEQREDNHTELQKKKLLERAVILNITALLRSQRERMPKKRTIVKRSLKSRSGIKQSCAPKGKGPEGGRPVFLNMGSQRQTCRAARQLHYACMARPNLATVMRPTLLTISNRHAGTEHALRILTGVTAVFISDVSMHFRRETSLWRVIHISCTECDGLLWPISLALNV